METNQRTRLDALWQPLAMAGLVAGVLLPLSLVPAYSLLESRVYDLASTIAPPQPATPGAVIVAVDEPSFSEMAQRWPWPRQLHARLVEKLRAAGARVIALDIIFSEPSTDEADRALAAALGPDTVLASDEVETRLDHGVQVNRVQPLDLLIETGATPGLTSVALEGDAALRAMPVSRDGFAMEALRKAGVAVEPAPPGSLIQFFGPARTYPTFSFYQALDPDNFLPPGSFKDRIVLVGLSLKASVAADSGSPDAFPTPFTLSTQSLTAGVEAQATILDNLLHHLYVTPISRLWTLALVVASALWGVYLARRGITWRSGFATILSVATLIVASWLLLRFGRLWAPPVLPVAATLLVVGSRLGIDYAQERRLRKAVSTAFSRYLSPDLVAQLAKDPSALRLGGERRNLTVLFCDVRGFTSLSERLKDEPERLTALINRLLDTLSGAILAEGGTIDKYMGDCVMAFWNAPLPSPDHALRAVRAAARMMQAVAELNRLLASEEGDAAPVFAVGIGINTGDCVVGNIGSRWRYDYSVLGDTVNLASRLEGLCKDYAVGLILGADTARVVGGEQDLIELDSIAVRGRATASSIYTVLEASAGGEDAEAEFRLLHEGFLTAFRSGERAVAAQLLTACKSRAPSLAGYYEKMGARLPAPSVSPTAKDPEE